MGVGRVAVKSGPDDLIRGSAEGRKWEWEDDGQGVTRRLLMELLYLVIARRRDELWKAVEG